MRNGILIRGQGICITEKYIHTRMYMYVHALSVFMCKLPHHVFEWGHHSFFQKLHLEATNFLDHL